MNTLQQSSAGKSTLQTGKGRHKFVRAGAGMYKSEARETIMCKVCAIFTIKIYGTVKR